MNKRFRDLDALIAALQSLGVSHAALTCKVATTTLAGGARLVFRGRVCVSADVADVRMEYQQEIPRREVEVGPDGLPVTAEYARELRRAQLELMRQIRLYREQYQSQVAEARQAVTEALAEAGIAVLE